jgi:hypothetical protein
MSPKCCGFDSRWVENVPGKGYFYCGECRKEVAESDIVFESANKLEKRKGWVDTANPINCACNDFVCKWCFDIMTGTGTYYSFTTYMYENDSESKKLSGIAAWIQETKPKTQLESILDLVAMNFYWNNRNFVKLTLNYCEYESLTKELNPLSSNGTILEADGCSITLQTCSGPLKVVKVRNVPSGGIYSEEL